MEGYTIDLVVDKARQLVQKAIALYRKDSGAALSEFSNPQGLFVNGEQYVFVLDSNGMMLAHGANQDYLGKDFYPITDIDGKMFIKEIIDGSCSHGSGCVEYKWVNPVTKTEEPKTVYFEKIDGVIICSGVYGAHPASSILENPLHEGIDPAPPADCPPLGLSAHDATTEMDEGAYGTRLDHDEAKRLVEKAIVFYKSNDNKTALAEFSNPQGIFVKGEQYVFVLDSNGMMLAHGVNEKYVGKDFYRTMDSDGKRFIKEIVDAANSKGSGWVEYKWLDPVTKTEEPKTVYFEKANGVIICSGIYSY